MAFVSYRDTAGADVIENPYLSVVATARNDDHGGNLLERMQIFVTGLLLQCRRHRVPAELVMVEWNPQPDRPGLAEALDWSAANEYCDVRIIQVPPALHQRFKHADAMPLYQMIAKNAGIRRARGEFVLATNIDLLFSDELFRFLAERRLDPARMYRADRWDVMQDVPAAAPLDEQLAWCHAHLLRVNRREGTFALHPDGSQKIDDRDIVNPERGVTLGARWFPREVSAGEPFRWVDNDAELVIGGPHKLLLLDVEPGPGVDNEPFALELREPGGAVVARVDVERRTRLTVDIGSAGPRLLLHTDQGGKEIATDLRTLNFRVFRCELTEEIISRRAPVRVDSAPVARIGRAARALGAALFSRSQIRIPMSRKAFERLDLRTDGSAVSFELGPLLRRRKYPDGIVGRGLTAMWERGWYDNELFRGEAFRWMPDKARLTLILPFNGAAHISLLVEAGPAAGFRGVLHVFDDRGKLLANANVRGRTWVDVPVSEIRGAATLELAVSAGREPQPVPGDTRSMALRLFRCEPRPEPPQHSGELKLVEFGSSRGVWGLTGCASRRGGMACSDGAAIMLGAADLWTLEAASPAGPARVAIRDAYGTVYFNGIISRSQVLPIRDPPPAAYTVLRISTDQPLTFAAATRESKTGDALRIPLGSARQTGPAHLHTNGCGDFTLLARERWFDLRGYPELDAFSMNVDSMLCWAAHHGGAREEVLADPIRIFHIEHATGSGWTPEGERKLYDRILAKGLPWVDYHDCLAWAAAMNRFDAPIIFNLDNWGLRDDALPEVHPQSACNRGRSALS